MSAGIKQSNIPYTCSHAQLTTLRLTNKLVEGREYKITDKGDKGIILTGVKARTLLTPVVSVPVTLSRFGTRLMQVPRTYAQVTIAGKVWLGVWKSTNTPAIGNLCIWGGMVWENLTGANGSVVNEHTLDAVNWLVISKQALTADTYYSQKDFKISYDFDNDWIEKQWDDKGNVMGIDYAEQTLLYGFAKNPVDLTDWNYETSGVVFAQNEAIGIYNNYIETVYSTSSSSYIYGVIQNNKIPGIIAQNIGNISNNTCVGSITTNVCPTVSDNRNKGGVTNNTCLLVRGNWNNGVITLNTTPIVDNGNNGDIRSNACNKGVNDNTNNGDIDNNTVAVGSLLSNQNNGAITSNSVIGDITFNANNGPIVGATSAVPVTISRCFNNGSVGSLGPYVANVGSAVVNL